MYTYIEKMPNARKRGIRELIIEANPMTCYKLEVNKRSTDQVKRRGKAAGGVTLPVFS